MVQLQDPLNLKDVLNLSGDLSIVAYEENSKQNEHTKLHQVLCQMKPGMTINIVVGPEGGLDAEEVAALEAQGYVSCSLGPRILRSETAPLYLMSVIAYHRELMKEDL